MKNARREQVMAALLALPTVKEASQVSGVSERAIYEWLAKPDFKREFEQRKGDIVAAAARHMQGKYSEAIDVVGEIMNDVSAAPQARLSAARIILDYGLRLAEQTEILTRLTDVENAVNGAHPQ